MIFEQFYLDCLSQASYLIGDETTNKAVVVDPRRDTEIYLESAEQHGLSVELIVETHFHADFLSGHLELAEATGATIAFGEAGRTEFETRALHDGERIGLGEVLLVVLATPGHTPESISIVVYEHTDDDIPFGVLTGDTLFVGDVGRPDLLASLGYTAEQLAEKLYDSLHDKLLTLPDATRVYPAHGAGSACGKQLSTATVSTIGEQRRTNYALAVPDRRSFIDAVTEGQPSAPGYFVFDATLNRKVRPLLHESEAPSVLTYGDLMAAADDGAVLLDTRDAAEYAKGHLRNSINVGLGGRFAEYAGSIADPDRAIALICDPGTEAEAKVRLGRIGYDNVLGHLDDAVQAMTEHPEVVDVSSRLTTSEFEQARRAGELQVIDIRNPGETARGTIPGAVTVPLATLRERVGELDPGVPTVVCCSGGYRSSVAASLLELRGFTDVSDLLGGYDGWVTMV
ncbi:MAG: MBL fold metallo-hydrolase [Acidobacteria bacterium]|nr:MAG: MBL fold metallo-hydrolase [Acidobacteriota bacterium]